MKLTSKQGLIAAGLCAGIVNGLFGAGGGMILVPMLTAFTDLDEDEIFPASISIILPLCIVSLALTFFHNGIPWAASWPYLIGSVAGGILSGLLGGKIPTLWLHRVLGVLILIGGVRYLW